MNTASETPPESWLASRSIRMVEACWLVAAGLIPVLYDPHSNAGYEVIKMTFVQILGLVTGGAALVHGLTTIRCGNTHPWKSPIGLFATSLAAAIALSTILSLNPAVSFWGGRLTYQGSFSLLALLLLGLGVALHLRTRAQLDRLLTATLLTGFPMTIYALLQRFGLDPLMTRSAESVVTSFAGQPIYLAGYLIMLIPLGIWRAAGSGTPSSQPGQFHRWFYGSLVVLLISVVVLTEKRGPFIALVVSGVYGALLLATYLRQRRLAVWSIGVGGAVLIALAGLAVLGKSGVPLGSIPVIGKLSMIVPIGGETGDAYRRVLWAKAPEILNPARPFNLPDGSSDPWRSWRIAFGQGPETFDAVIARHNPFAHQPDFPTKDERFHNGFWDTLQSLGGLGLVATVGLMLSVFAAGYARLGFLPAKSPTILLGAICLVTAVFGSGALGCLYGPGFIGLGFHLGLAAGLALPPLWLARRQPPKEVPAEDQPIDHLTIALLVALMAHFLDMAFVYPTGSTSTLFWIILGTATAVVWWTRPAAETTCFKNTTPSSDAWSSPGKLSTTPAQAGRLGGLLSAIVLVGMLHAFINFYSGEPVRLGQVLHASLARIRFAEGPSYLLPLLFIPSWLLLNLGWGVGLASGPKNSPRLHTFLLAGIWSLALAVSYALAKGWAVARVSPLSLAARSDTAALAQLAAIETISASFLVIVFGAILGLTLLLPSGQPAAPQGRVPWMPWSVAVLVGVFFGIAAWFSARHSLWKENCALWGRILFGNGYAEGAAFAYRRALDHAPEYHPARITLAETLGALGSQTSDPRKSAQYFEQAASALHAGRARSELNDANYFLATLHLEQALREPNLEAKKSHAQSAQESFTRALVFSPDFEPAWFGTATAERLLGRNGSAAEKLARADAITRLADPLLWGDFYGERALSFAEPALRDLYTQRAIHYLDRIIRQPQGERERAKVDVKHLRILIQKGNLLRSSGRLREAVECFQAATQAEAGVEIWQAEALLAFTLADLGDLENALTYAGRAIGQASPEAQQNLARLTADLRRATGRRP